MLNWDGLKSVCADCTRCGLCETRHNVVFGVGNENADIMFVGEGPGEQEDLKGQPFVGPAGKLLDDMLCIIDLSRETNCYIANIVKCRPPPQPRPPGNGAGRLHRLSAQSGGAGKAEDHRLPWAYRRQAADRPGLPHHETARPVGGAKRRLDDGHLSPVGAPAGRVQAPGDL